MGRAERAGGGSATPFPAGTGGPPAREFPSASCCGREPAGFAAAVSALGGCACRCDGRRVRNRRRREARQRVGDRHHRRQRRGRRARRRAGRFGPHRWLRDHARRRTGSRGGLRRTGFVFRRLEIVVRKDFVALVCHRKSPCRHGAQQACWVTDVSPQRVPAKACQGMPDRPAHDPPHTRAVASRHAKALARDAPDLDSLSQVYGDVGSARGVDVGLRPLATISSLDRPLRPGTRLARRSPTCPMKGTRAGAV